MVYDLTGVSENNISAQIKKDHPKGTKIMLISCSCPLDPVHKGSVGEVLFIDHAGCMHVKFEHKTACLSYEDGDRWKILYDS